jgi:hypothetical protein
MNELILLYQPTVPKTKSELTREIHEKFTSRGQGTREITCPSPSNINFVPIDADA